MSIADTLIEVVIYLLNSISSRLPQQIAALPIHDFQSSVDSLVASLQHTLGSIDFIFPSLLFCGLLLGVFSLELLGVIFRTVRFIINLIRGSGA